MRGERMGRDHRPVVRRARLTVGSLVALVSVVALAACTGSRAPSFVVPPPPPAKLIFSHEANEPDASPGKNVLVQVEDGTLETVSLVSTADGVETDQIDGEFDEERRSWTNTVDLEFDTSYTLKVSSKGLDGKPVSDTRSFTTLAVPEGHYYSVAFVTSEKWYKEALDGGTFGVGQPIVAVFNDVPDKAVVEAALEVTTVPAVEGRWSWITDRVAHWRPQEYWTPGTQVSVKAKILGLELTSPHQDRTLWGQENITASFTIGQSKIAKVDDKTHKMLVYIDGVMVREIPVSMGQNYTYTDTAGKQHNYRTYSGIHVVTEKHNPVVMKSAVPCPDGPGTPTCDPAYYEEVVAYAVRITDSGVYVHSAPWSVWAQGKQNVSHGCVNIGPTNAAWFYEEFNAGDVVEIVNTGRDLYPQYENNGTTDWNTPWDVWVAGSALPETLPSATPTASASAG